MRANSSLASPSDRGASPAVDGASLAETPFASPASLPIVRLARCTRGETYDCFLGAGSVVPAAGGVKGSAGIGKPPSAAALAAAVIVAIGSAALAGIVPVRRGSSRVPAVTVLGP